MAALQEREEVLRVWLFLVGVLSSLSSLTLGLAMVSLGMMIYFNGFPF